MTSNAPRFTDALTDEERALLSFGLTVTLFELKEGHYTGAPDLNHALATIPVIVDLMGELGEAFDFKFSDETLSIVEMIRSGVLSDAE